jgi:hypothetical protein
MAAPLLTAEMTKELRRFVTEQDRTLKEIREWLREQYGLDVSHGFASNWKRRLLSEETVEKKLSTGDLAEQAAHDRLRAEGCKAALAVETAKDAFLDVDALEERRRLYATRADEVWQAIPASQKRSVYLYIRLEDLHLRALSLKLKIAALTPDTDQISDVDEILTAKIAKLSERAGSSETTATDSDEGNES